MVIGPWTKSTETPPTSVGKPLFATGKIGSERRATTPKTETARTCPGAAVIVFEGLRYPKPATVTPVWACINAEQPSARKTQQVRERVVKNKWLLRLLPTRTEKEKLGISATRRQRLHYR